jgi:hypothetical protein
MKHILIYGTSIFLAGLAEQVRALPNTRVETRQSLTGLGDVAVFDAVLVDLNNPATANVLTLLRARPDLTMIGVNQATGTLTVLAGQTYLVQDLDDIMTHLQNIPPNPMG